MINIKNFKELLQDCHPHSAIILGSGLGAVADSIKNPLIIKYSDIEGFPTSTVPGHKGQMVIGTMGKHEVLCMQGRFHLYEGYQPIIIRDMIGSLKQIGIERLVITNAAGSLNPDFHPGEIMLISDLINFSGLNPLVGPNDNELGPRFVDMSSANDLEIRNQFKQIAQKLKITVHEGTYLMVTGPNFETPAEIKAFRVLGADAVGMSTIPEIIAAAYCGIRTVAMSVITNFGAGMQKEKLSHEQTLECAAKGAASLTKLIKAYFSEV